MILLVCDHVKRELYGLRFLQEELDNLGIPSKIINKHSVIRAFNHYKPKIIVFPQTRLFADVISKVEKRVITILVPSEHCALNKDFIKMHYCGYFKNYKVKSSHSKIDHVFVQGKFIKNFLVNNKYFNKKKIIVSGHLHYDFWKNAKKKEKTNKISNIGIALTNEFAFRRYQNKNFLQTLYFLNNEADFYSNYWRLFQINYNFYYICLIYDVIKKLINQFKINLRTHVVDVESNFDFIKSKNFNHNSKISAYEWIQEQDIIISSVSFMNIDSYIFKKPHISLINLIPKEFFFEAYKSYTYKNFDEPNSFKPTTKKEFFKIISKVKFKKNKILDKKLKSYYNYPYAETPTKIIGSNLKKIYLKNNKIFKFIHLKKDQLFVKLFGKTLGYFIVYQLSQIKSIIKYRRESKNWYFDFFFKR